MKKKQKKTETDNTLTPGSVFCSCSAFWALRADSRAQYVRKAHPGKTKTTSVTRSLRVSDVRFICCVCIRSEV